MCALLPFAAVQTWIIACVLCVAQKVITKDAHKGTASGREREILCGRQRKVNDFMSAWVRRLRDKIVNSPSSIYRTNARQADRPAIVDNRNNSYKIVKMTACELLSRYHYYDQIKLAFFASLVRLPVSPFVHLRLFHTSTALIEFQKLVRVSLEKIKYMIK